MHRYTIPFQIYSGTPDSGYSNSNPHEVGDTDHITAFINVTAITGDLTIFWQVAKTRDGDWVMMQKGNCDINQVGKYMTTLKHGLSIWLRCLIYSSDGGADIELDLVKHIGG